MLVQPRAQGFQLRTIKIAAMRETKILVFTVTFLLVSYYQDRVFIRLYPGFTGFTNVTENANSVGYNKLPELQTSKYQPVEVAFSDHNNLCSTAATLLPSPEREASARLLLRVNTASRERDGAEAHAQRLEIFSGLGYRVTEWTRVFDGRRDTLLRDVRDSLDAPERYAVDTPGGVRSTQKIPGLAGRGFSNTSQFDQSRSYGTTSISMGMDTKSNGLPVQYAKFMIRPAVPGGKAGALICAVLEPSTPSVPMKLGNKLEFTRLITMSVKKSQLMGSTSPPGSVNPGEVPLTPPTMI
jgi:hypothetical protein